MHQVVMQDAPIIRSPVRSVGRQIRPPSVPAINESDVYRPNFQSISMVASLKLFRLQQQLAGIETESDESSDEWKPVQQLYNPMVKQVTKKKLLVSSDMQNRLSVSNHEPYYETYSRSTNSYESCPTTNLLSLS